MTFAPSRWRRSIARASTERGTCWPNALSVRLSSPTNTTFGFGRCPPRIDSRASIVLSSMRSSAPTDCRTAGTPIATAATSASSARRVRRWRARTAVQATGSVVVAKKREPLAEGRGMIALQGDGGEHLPVAAVALQVAPPLRREPHVDDPRLVLGDAQVGAAVFDVVTRHDDRTDTAVLEGAARADSDQPVVDPDLLLPNPHGHLRLRAGAEPAGLAAELAA